MEYDATDLWLGSPVNVDDDTWHAVEYDDGAVQFIHKEDHTQIWQDRTVVSTKAGRGRAEAHYIEANDTIMLALANNNRSPPEHGTVVEASFVDDWGSLGEAGQDGILWLLLVEWAESIGYVVSVPLTSDMVDAAASTIGDVDEPSSFDDATTPQRIKRGIEGFRAGEQRYQR